MNQTTNADAPSVVATYMTLIFSLQAAWPFVHGCKDEVLKNECSQLLRDRQLSEDLNVRLRTALEKAWEHVDKPINSWTARREVAKAIFSEVQLDEWDKSEGRGFSPLPKKHPLKCK